MSLGLLSSIFCWPRVKKTEQEAAQSGCLSGQEQREAGERVGTGGRQDWMGLLLGESSPFLPLPQLYLPLQPLEPVRSWRSLVAWVAGGQAAHVPRCS